MHIGRMGLFSSFFIAKSAYVLIIIPDFSGIQVLAPFTVVVWLPGFH
jgi:hypothetical protein